MENNTEIKNKRIGIVGAGNLGKSIIDALLNKGIKPRVSNLIEENYKGIEIKFDNIGLVNNSDIVLLCVKPQAMRKVMEEITPYIKDKLIITFAAGIPLKFYESFGNGRFVRVMTNLSIKYSKAVNLYILGRNTTQEDEKTSHELLSLLGTAIKTTNEELIDVHTAISGSGIAYFMKFIELFIKKAQESGFSYEMSKKIILSTIEGARVMIENSDEEIPILISKVASKGGTTEKGLKEMEEKGLNRVINSVLEKTIEKCKELGKNYG